MKFIYQYLFAGIILFMLPFAGCKKDNKTGVHNSSAPIVINKFEPEIGGGGTEVLITGSNFTSDTSQLSVTLNGKKLKVVGSNSTQMIVVIPKKAGTGAITVKIGNSTVSTTDNFTYIFTHIVTTLAGSGVAGYNDAQGTAAQFNIGGQNWYRSIGLTVDDQLNVYVADVGNHCIRKIDSLGNVTTFCGNPSISGYADGKGTNALFSLPYGLAIDNKNNIYCVDAANYDIRKITPDGNAVTLGFAAQDPWCIAVDKKTGYIYYTGNNNPANVYQITPTGTNTIISGLFYPGGIAIDDSGNIYISTNQVIQKFNAGNWASSTIAGQANVVGYVDSVGTKAEFASPYGLAIDANNNIYVGENGTWNGDVHNPDQSVRYIDGKTYAVSTYAGSASPGFSNGVGSLASFSAPIGVAVDKNGTVYVLDKNNNSIRKIVSQ